MGGFIAWTGGRLQASAIQQAEHDLQIQTQVVAGVLSNAFEDLSERRGGNTGLAALVSNYGQTLGFRIVVLDSRLAVLASSDDAASAADAARAPEVIAAQRGEPDHARRLGTGGEQRIFAAAPIGESGHRPSGVVQLSRPLSDLNAQIYGIWLGLLSAGAVVALGGVLVSLALARRLARPIQELTAVSAQLADGALSQRVIPDGPDEIRRLGESFNQMVERLEQMLVNQRTFVAYAAHELRSPLASMRLRIEMLETSRAQRDEALAGRYIDQIGRDIVRLSQLVDQLLTLTSLDESQQPPLAPVDLAPLIYELADEVAPAARSVGLALQINVPDHLPEVPGNASQLRMAIRNLLENAIKYTSAGGSVGVTAHADDSILAISVSDSGIGLTDEQRARVFDRFYRGKPELETRRDGFGLGLALVQAIVNAHRGEVQVSSQRGKGSTFTIRLPLALSDSTLPLSSSKPRDMLGTLAP